MRTLEDHQLVQLWELGEGRHAVDRAILLLLAADPASSQDDVVRLTVGQRNRRLLQLREQTFGPTLLAAASCPNCDEKLEFAMSVDELRQPETEESIGQTSINGYEIDYRLPDSRDLAAIVGLKLSEAARELLERCVMAVRPLSRDADRPAPDPAAVLSAVSAAIAEKDPQADLWLELACSNCDHEWESQFDIASYFWAELGARAQRLMYDVSRLATVYGWSESEVLALGPARREHYLELASR